MSLMGNEQSHLLLAPKNLEILAYKTIFDGGAILGGGIEEGMTAIVVGFDVQGAAGIVEVPAGWTNDAFFSNTNTSTGGAASIWHRNGVVAESPNWFTNEFDSVLHVYGFEPGVILSRAVTPNVYWANIGGSGDPPSESADLSGLQTNRPGMFVGAFASTGAIGAGNDLITYNGGNQVMRRDAAVGQFFSLNTIARINLHAQGLVGLTGMNNVTYDLSDLGSRNGYAGALLWADW